MKLTNNGLDQIEKHAEMQHNATVMLLCQAIREIREVKALLKQGYDACNRCDSGCNGADNCKN